MKLNELKSIKDKSKKRIGRGYGSGKGGHTTVRGQKGQKSRGKIPLWFIGTSKVWFKHLPMIRGKSRQKSFSQNVKIITLTDLNVFKSGETVNAETLLKKGVIDKGDDQKYQLKVLGSGKLETKELKVELPVSSGAEKAIKKLGGVIQGETS